MYSIATSIKVWPVGLKMSLANFNMANTCAPHAPPLHIITHAVLARVFGGINFGDLIKHLPICQNLNFCKSFWLYGIIFLCAIKRHSIAHYSLHTVLCIQFKLVLSEAPPRLSVASSMVKWGEPGIFSHMTMT